MQIPFEWISANINGNSYSKAAISIPINIKGKEYKFQFDTGTPRSFIYEYQLIKRVLSISNEKMEFEVGFGNVNKRLNFLIDAESKHIPNEFSNNDVLGLIGNDFFKDRILIINFPLQTISFINGERLNKLKVDYLNSSFDGKFFKLSLDTMGRPKDFILDTGSSIFPLVTTFDNWKVFTKKDKLEHSEITLEVTASKGRLTRLFGALSQTDISFGKINLNSQMIYFEENDVTNFKGIGVEGLIGNTAFLKHTLILDYLNKKIGII